MGQQVRLQQRHEGGLGAAGILPVSSHFTRKAESTMGMPLARDTTSLAVNLAYFLPLHWMKSTWWWRWLNYGESWREITWT